MSVNKLNLKQKKFCEEYLKHFNGTKAYALAYEDSDIPSARSSASRLLTDANIIAYLSNTKRAISKIMSPEEILEELSDFARKNKNNKSKDFLHAVTLLGKYHHMFADRLEVTHSLEEIITESFQIDSKDVTELSMPGDVDEELEAAASDPDQIALIDDESNT
jgi:phage terminase small subunit